MTLFIRRCTAVNATPICWATFAPVYDGILYHEIGSMAEAYYQLGNEIGSGFRHRRSLAHISVNIVSVVENVCPRASVTRPPRRPHG